jgi:hypothetical protein
VRSLGLPGSFSLSEQVNDIAFEIEKLYHGTPSGIDITVITYASQSNQQGKPIEIFKPRQPFTIVIGDTGVPAPTKESVAELRALWEKDRTLWEGIFTEVGEIVKEARRAIENGKINRHGELMDRNHALLQHMTVSSPQVEQLIEAARHAGALGAKVSGGGRGGNIIALLGSAPTATALDQMQACLLQALWRVIATELHKMRYGTSSSSARACRVPASSTLQRRQGAGAREELCGAPGATGRSSGLVRIPVCGRIPGGWLSFSYFQNWRGSGRLRLRARVSCNWSHLPTRKPEGERADASVLGIPVLLRPTMYTA